MLKLLVISAVALFAKADPSDFPAMDPQHPHCQIQANYNERTCDQMYDRFNAVIKSFEGDDPGKGTFAFKEEAG